MIDRRVRKSRDAIYAAFMSLVVSRGYDGLNMLQIADEADVGRTTLYAHFRSKEEIVKFGFSSFKDEVYGTYMADVAEHPLPFIESIFEHVRRYLPFYLLMRGSSAEQLVDAEFAAVVEAVVFRAGGVRTVLENQMIAGAIMAGLRAWMRDQAAVKPAALAEVVRRMVSPQNHS